jgi:hypothetical protein
LTVKQIIVGTSTTTVSGRLAYNTIIPVGQRVSITLNGVRHYATVAADGSFSVNFATGCLGVGTYRITYRYAGDSNFTPISGTGSLTVAYGSQLLFNNSEPVHSGAVLAIKLSLTNAKVRTSPRPTSRSRPSAGLPHYKGWNSLENLQ